MPIYKAFVSNEKVFYLFIGLFCPVCAIDDKCK